MQRQVEFSTNILSFSCENNRPRKLSYDNNQAGVLAVYVSVSIVLQGEIFF